MKDGFIKVAAGSVRTTVADVTANLTEIKNRIAEASEANVNLLVLPELALTGYTCGDLFFSEVLQNAAMHALGEICDCTAGKELLVVLGLPVKHRGKLYNCAAAVQNGQVLAFVPKTHIPCCGGLYEPRQFASGEGLEDVEIIFRGQAVPFGVNVLLQHDTMENYCVGIEIAEDLWAPSTPGEFLTASGATILVNPAADDEGVGKADYRRLLLKSTSARLLCGYVFANAGPTESTQDSVYSQHHLIAENGELLAENLPFGTANLIISEVDVDRLAGERHRHTSFVTTPDDSCILVPFHQTVGKTALTRKIEKNPFVVEDAAEMNTRCETILQIQSMGLKKRLEHTWSKTAVIGISGGLDSCLALLVMVRAMDLMGKSRKDIIAVTMPCFGTSQRTKTNAELLCEYLGVTLRTVPIAAAVTQHFQDIGHDPNQHDVTFENAQARERTQVIMDIANQMSGLVIGTGDLSELALGWATYNGDHMSMYGVNGAISKTLVRALVRYEAGRYEKKLADVLYDILDTPVSPELLPADENGQIKQKTEDLVGPYELHDFFLYYIIRLTFRPSKVYRLAKHALGDVYDDETIKKWLHTFVRRFFIQQFKRSCIPDGPKVGSTGLSPRANWRMPTDAVSRLWLEDLEHLDD